MNYYFAQINNSPKKSKHKNQGGLTIMAIVSKKKAVTTTNNTTKKTTEAPAKKTTEVKAEAPVVAEKKTANKGGKKMTLTGNTKTPKSFEIKEGTQATQEAFIDKYYKKLQALGYDITKEQAKALKKAYSETLREVTDLASYQDVDAGMYYARRYIETRVTQPPKAKDGLKTLMMGHYEIKVRKTVGDVNEYKFFGDLNEDGNIFITTDGEEIPLNTEEEVEVKPVAKKKVSVKKPAPVVEEEEEDVVEEEVIDDDDEFDDFLEDDED